RTLRRTLGDDSREPRFIRTVSRHGYQFVAEVRETPDDGPMGTAPVEVAPPLPGEAVARPAETEDSASADWDVQLARLLRRPPFESARDEERREAAEALHALGTADALERLDGLPGHAEARAILRDARWDVPGAGDVPLRGAKGGWAAMAYLVRLRLRLAAREMSNRWGAAALGGAAAGAVAGCVGGVALWLVPESQAGPNVVLALALVGAVAGTLGAAGVGAGLSAAEVLARSRRAAALVACGAAGGMLAGAVTHLLTRAVVSGVFGRALDDIAGAFEGIVIGGAAGFGYA